MDAAQIERDKRVEPLELFFDLVFVFAITQVTARLSARPTWGGLLHGMLILAAIWWAWAAYAWLTNEIDSRRWEVRLAVFASMAAMLVASLSIPRAFESDALAFGCAYLVVRLLHIVLFAQGTDDVGVRQAARAIAPTSVVAAALIIAASALRSAPAAQVALWVVALAIDYGGGAVRGIERWRLSPGHFAERHGLIILIALGESIVAIGAGATRASVSIGVIVASVLGIAVAAALWWTYFDDSARQIEQRLRDRAGRARNAMARDSFSLLHLPMLAGIVLLALGVKKTLGDFSGTLAVVPAFALCGGVALYLVSDVAFRRRCLGTVEARRLVAAAGSLAAVSVAVVAPALVALAVVAAICGSLILLEARSAAAEAPSEVEVAPPAAVDA